MNHQLAEKKLKCGKSITIIRVAAPDPEWEKPITAFLSHKGYPWSWQIGRSFSSSVSPLDVYYYIAVVDGEIVANVSTAEYRGVAILGHVYTHPDHRRMGICSAVMSFRKSDFQSRGGNAVYLATDINGHAWHIYSGFGFGPPNEGRPFHHNNATMAYFEEGQKTFESNYFQKTESLIRPADWRDWATLSALTCLNSGSKLRLVGLDVHNIQLIEYPYLLLLGKLLEGKADVLVMESHRTGATLGIVSIMTDPRFAGVGLFDLLVHPRFQTRAGELLNALPPNGPWHKLQAYAESSDERKIQTLKTAGFSIEAELKEQMKLDNGLIDVVVMGKKTGK